MEDVQLPEVLCCNAQGGGAELGQRGERVWVWQPIGVGLAGRIRSAAGGHWQRRQGEFEFSQADHGGLVAIKQGAMIIRGSYRLFHAYPFLR